MRLDDREVPDAEIDEIYHLYQAKQITQASYKPSLVNAGLRDFGKRLPHRIKTDSPSDCPLTNPLLPVSMPCIEQPAHCFLNNRNAFASVTGVFVLLRTSQ